MQEQVAQLLPQREGHFVFESGHHGQVWLDLELLLLHPERVQPLAAALADRLRRHQIAAVCGPLVEGAFVGLMVASRLRLPFSYSQPVKDHRAAGLFIARSSAARLILSAPVTPRFTLSKGTGPSPGSRRPRPVCVERPASQCGTGTLRAGPWPPPRDRRVPWSHRA